MCNDVNDRWYDGGWRENRGDDMRRERRRGRKEEEEKRGDGGNAKLR